MIERSIYLVRGQKVMLDRDLAALYQVETKALNRAVKRNAARFPADFMYQLTIGETENLRCQFGTSSWGGRRYRAYAFTEYGAVMLAGVLNSDRAIMMSILVVRSFVRLREVMATHKELAEKIRDIERNQLAHGRHIEALHEAIRSLMLPEPKPARRIGFAAPTARAR